MRSYFLEEAEDAETDDEECESSPRGKSAKRRSLASSAPSDDADFERDCESNDSFIVGDDDFD